jgi:hypothetical protein
MLNPSETSRRSFAPSSSMTNNPLPITRMVVRMNALSRSLDGQLWLRRGWGGFGLGCERPRRSRWAARPPARCRSWRNSSTIRCAYPTGAAWRPSLRRSLSGRERYHDVAIARRSRGSTGPVRHRHRSVVGHRAGRSRSSSWRAASTS